MARWSTITMPIVRPLISMHQEKKNLPMIFHLGTCAIGMCLVLLAGHWQAIGKWGNKLAANCLILYQLAGNGTSGTIGWMPYCLRPQYVIFSWGAIFACTHTSSIATLKT